MNWYATTRKKLFFKKKKKTGSSFFHQCKHDTPFTFFSKITSWVLPHYWSGASAASTELQPTFPSTSLPELIHHSKLITRFAINLSLGPCLLLPTPTPLLSWYRVSMRCFMDLQNSPWSRTTAISRDKQGDSFRLFPAPLLPSPKHFT